MVLRERFEGAKDITKRWLAEITGEGALTPDIPTSDKNEDVAEYVKSLFEDSKSWRQRSLQARFKYFQDPVMFWKLCRKLESGDHWEVFGRRNKELGSEWRHEIIDNQIGDQTRVRKSYLTANWHDVTVLPNLSHIDEIIQQERDRSEWGRTIKLGTHRCLVEGTAIFKTILDETENRDGQIREILCDNESILPTPQSKSFKRLDGCWYTIHATVATMQQAKEEFPDFDESDTDVINAETAKDIKPTRDSESLGTFKNTKFVERYELWMDDSELVDKDFDPQEAEQEHASIHNGQDVKPKDTDNHLAHINAHLDQADTVLSGSELGNPDDQANTEAFINYLMEHIDEHKELANKEIENHPNQPYNKKPKYPYGRKVVVIGGKVAQDIPNALEMDWRCYFRKVVCEELPEQFWGRGICEILWNSNHVADTMLSRIADQAVTTGTPKPWFHYDDKEFLAETGFNNDPTKPGFYSVAAPTFPKGELSPALMEIYNTMTQMLTRSQGVNETTYGEAPGAESSAKLVQTLLRQNVIIVTGEANQNFNDAIEDIIDTRIRMMRELYTEPRPYVINGQVRNLIVSRELKYQTIQGPDGTPTQVEIPFFDIRVKANSNFPNQWESEFGFALSLATSVMADGMPILNREAVLDFLAQKFPEWGRNGPYYKMAQATMIGLQVMKQQQAKQLEDKRTMQQYNEKLKGAGMKELTGGGNGSTMVGQA
jgi:hypothetical protein